MQKKALLFGITVLLPLSFLTSCGSSGSSSNKYNFTYYDGHSIEVEVPKDKDVKDYYPENTAMHDDEYKEYTYTWEYKQSNNYQEKQNITKISEDFYFEYADGRKQTIEVPRGHPVDEFFPTDHSGDKYDYGDEGYGTKTIYTDWVLDSGTTYVETSSEINIYGITYVIPDGAENPSKNPTWVEYTTEHTLLPASWTGYEFNGWFVSSTYEGKVTEIKNTNTPRTLYGKFTPIEYDISYHLDGGSNTNPDRYTIATPVALADSSKEGYTFKGWYLDSDFKESITVIENRTGDLDLYAKFVIIEYDIIYYLDGGTNSPDNPNTYTVIDAFTFADAAKTGYTFNGWYTDNQFNNEIKGINQGTMGVKQLYAKFTVIEYNIKYNLDEGTNNPDNPSTFTIESSISLLDPTKTGYTFNGWYEDPGFSKKITNISGRSESLELWANFSIKEYGITYHLDGGTNPQGNPNKYTVTDEFTLLDAKKTGYTFEGWYKEDTFSNKIEKINTGSTGDLNLYAKFTAIQYSITYYLDGGDNPGDNPTIYTIESEKVLSDATKTECTFDGWYKEDTFVTKVTSLNGLHENLDLYAKFIKNTYTITYELEEGENPNVTSYTYYDNVTFAPATKTGYTFGGWYSNPDRTTSISGWTAKSMTGNQTIYGGGFTATPYDISYVLDGGKNPAKNPKTYTIEDDDITLLDATDKEGYSFDGWYKDSGFEEKINKIEKGSTGNLTLYAKFVPNVYEAHLDAGGGYFSSDQNFVYLNYCFEGYETKKVTADSQNRVYPYKESIPDIKDYIFAGWYKDKNYTEKFETGDLVPLGSALYAKWNHVTTYESVTSINDNAVRPKTDTYSLDATYTYIVPAQFVKLSFHLYYSGYKSSPMSTTDYYTRYIISYDDKQYDSGKVYETKSEDKIITVSPLSTVSIKCIGARRNDQSKKYPGSPMFYSNGKIMEQKPDTYFSSELVRLDYSNLSSYVDYSSDFNPLTPVREGYTFVGWEDEEGNPYTPGTWNFTEDKTFTAQWEINIYNVTYHLPDGAENSPSNPSTFTIEDNKPLYDPAYDGYTFNGWFTDSGYINRITEIKGLYQHLNLYAKFTANTYDVILDCNDGAIKPSVTFISDSSTINTQVLGSEDTLEYKVPSEKSGALFAGWCADEECTKDFNFTETISEDTKLYAKWIDVSDGAILSKIGDTKDVSITGTTEYTYAFVPLTSGSITLHSTSGTTLDVSGILYDSNMTKLKEGEDKSGEDLNFTLTYSVTKGKLYYLKVKGQSSSWSGSAVVHFEGTYLPTSTSIGTSIDSKTITVTYGDTYVLPTNVYKAGATFKGWYDQNGKKYESIGTWQLASGITLHAEWE